MEKIKSLSKNRLCGLSITIFLMLFMCVYNVYCSYNLAGGNLRAIPLGFTCRRMMLIVLFFGFVALHFIFDINKLYDFIFRKRFWIAVIVFAFMVLNKFNFSSIGLFDAYVQPGEGSVYTKPLFGVARSIRSDEWMVTTPRLMTTDYVGYGETNDIVRATETNNLSASGLQGGYSILARPAYLGFYIFRSSAYGLAWMWNFYIIFGFLATFELCYIMSQQNRLLGLFGASLIGLSQFCMWWSITTFIFTGSAAVVCFKYFLNEQKVWKRLLFGAAMSMAIANFAVDLYPAWQVPAGFIFLAIVIWILVEDRERWMKYKLKDWGIFALVLVFLVSITGAYLYKYQDYMNAVMNTVYPGARISYGGYSLNKLVAYLSSAMTPFLRFDNPSEMGCFFGVFPIAPVLAVIVLIKKKGKNLLLWLLAVPTVVMGVYCSVGLPPIVAKCTLLTFSTPQRVADIVGLASAFMLIIALSELKDDKLPVWLASVIVIICTSFAVRYEYNTRLNDNRFALAVVLAAILVVIQVLVISNWKADVKKVAIILATIFVAVTGLAVNPLMYSNLAIRSKPLAQEVNRIMESDPDSKWIALDSIANGNFLIACGAPTYNSANYIPNMELWKKFDPEGAYEEIYNRYAHVVFSMTTEATTMELIQGDFFRVNLSYSDLEKLDVDYICSISPLDESYGLTMEYAQGGIYVYKNIGN